MAFLNFDLRANNANILQQRGSASSGGIFIVHCRRPEGRLKLIHLVLRVGVYILPGGIPSPV
ncbi:hypothetical protein ACPOL_6400 [Acidisarcina polymorpha]|uniref:Uncharacterized protein n=1 Tax=Acidisarcina polymorpha TaxID=2211140 RepID=A0A2Z5G9P5_9BACT|nr:hypothetical protein ACPOL_6400 [Acidisarcina polymorpha]